MRLRLWMNRKKQHIVVNASLVVTDPFLIRATSQVSLQSVTRATAPVLTKLTTVARPSSCHRHSRRSTAALTRLS
jgi:hypothetical protein